MKIANKISVSFLITGLVLTLIGGSVFYTIAKNNLKNAIFKHLEAKCCGNMEEGGAEMKSQRSAWARVTDDAEVLIY